MDSIGFAMRKGDYKYLMQYRNGEVVIKKYRDTIPKEAVSIPYDVLITLIKNIQEE